ncbi:hypothetical protein ACN47E_008569 [Coniothyrium glycines]
MAPLQLGAFATMALAASAVLLPPGMATKDFGDDTAIETLATDPFKRSVTLDCPGCGFASLDGDRYTWIPDAGNAFQLDFEVASEMNLNLDGNRLYPPSLSYFAHDFRVTQIDPSSEEALRLRVTGYRFSYDPAETISEEGLELMPLNLQILTVEEMPVSLPSLTINLLKDSEGRIMIASFQAAHPTEASPIDKEKECNQWPLLCKWKGILADRLEGMRKMGKGCHKRPHGYTRPNPMAEDTLEGKPPHRFRPGKPHHHPHHRPHHMGGHRHHGHHRVHMFLRRALYTILIPIVIGIFAGTLTYLLGMALGCLIAMVIAKVRGQSYQRIALEDVEDVEDVKETEVGNEKEEYAELPAYEAPPVYDEASEKEADASK